MDKIGNDYSWFFNWKIWILYGSITVILFTAAILNSYFEIRKKDK
jgi:hypothetical protein